MPVLGGVSDHRQAHGCNCAATPSSCPQQITPSAEKEISGERKRAWLLLGQEASVYIMSSFFSKE